MLVSSTAEVSTKELFCVKYGAPLSWMSAEQKYAIVSETWICQVLLFCVRCKSEENDRDPKAVFACTPVSIIMFFFFLVRIALSIFKI